MKTQAEVKHNKKSGIGLQHGVVSELVAFFDIKPGHEQEIRAAVARFAEALRMAPPEETIKTSIRDSRHVVFDGGTRLIWMTTFEADWDPYFEDALLVVGVDPFLDWLQHTVQYAAIEGWMKEAGGRDALRAGKGSYKSDQAREKAVRASSHGLKNIVQSVQTPAAAYFNAIYYLTHPEIRKAQAVDQAFQKVLDDPNADKALENPTLKPLLEQAAS